MSVELSWTTINTILASLCAVTTFGLGVYAWSRTDVKGGRIFSVMLVFEAIRLAGYAIEIASVNDAMIVTASKIQYVGLFVVAIWFMFTLSIAGHENWFSWRGLLALLTIPVVVFALALTNELHNLIWINPRAIPGDPYTQFTATYGSFFFVYFLYTVVLLFAGIVILLNSTIHRWALFRTQIILWLAGTLIPAFGHYSMVFGWRVFQMIHPIPLTYTVGAFLLSFAVFRLRLIDVMPVPYQAIFDNVPNEIIVFDKRRRVVAYNPAAQKFAADQRLNLIGKPIEQSFPKLSNVLNMNNPAAEIHVDQQDFKVRVAPSVDRSGRVRGHILILTDITAMKQAEREQSALLDRISRLEQLKGDMIRIGAHDLKDPLTSIVGYLELIKSEPDNQTVKEIQPYLDVIHRAAESIRPIVNDILSLDRIERMADEQTLEYFDIAETVKTAFNEASVRAANKEQVYILNISGENFTLCGDEVQIREAISNLISNAIKYTPSTGRIMAKLYHEESGIIFEVMDSGFGIPETMQAKLFQPFYRAKTSETRGTEGTGLGLYLVKGIVERHNGTMIVRSSYGKGSTFGFKLPAGNPPIRLANESAPT